MARHTWQENVDASVGTSITARKGLERSSWHQHPQLRFPRSGMTLSVACEIIRKPMVFKRFEDTGRLKRRGEVS